MVNVLDKVDFKKDYVLIYQGTTTANDLEHTLTFLLYIILTVVH